MDRHGNTSAASIPIALHEMAENDLLRPGQTLACIGFGGGLTWGGMLLTYEGRNEAAQRNFRYKISHYPGRYG